MSTHTRKFPKKVSRKHGFQTILCKTTKRRKKQNRTSMRKGKRACMRKANRTCRRTGKRACMRKAKRTGRFGKDTGGMMEAYKYAVKQATIQAKKLGETAKELVVGPKEPEFEYEDEVEELQGTAAKLKKNVDDVSDALRQRQDEIHMARIVDHQMRIEAAEQVRVNMVSARMDLEEEKQEEEDPSVTLEKVKTYMKHEHENQIVQWKRKYRHLPTPPDYTEYLREEYPENIQISSDGTIEIDERVLGPEWLGVFEKVTADDTLHTLGPLPGLPLTTAPDQECDEDSDWEFEEGENAYDLTYLKIKLANIIRRYSYVAPEASQLLRDVVGSISDVQHNLGLCGRSAVEEMAAAQLTIRTLKSQVKVLNNQLTEIMGELVHRWDPGNLIETVLGADTAYTAKKRGEAAIKRAAVWRRLGSL